MEEKLNSSSDEMDNEKQKCIQKDKNNNNHDNKSVFNLTYIY